jgi:peptide/nickel transport system ATP-binding protein
MDKKNLLNVRHLKMWFPLRSGTFRRETGYVKAVDDVSFAIQPGETLGLVGESGCGKTTVGRCIVRAYQPTSGEIHYYERSDNGAAPAAPIDLAQLNRQSMRRYRQEIRMIFQDPYSSLNPRMTVFEIVSEVLKVNHLATGRELEDRVASLLQRSSGWGCARSTCGVIHMPSAAANASASSLRAPWRPIPV